MNKIQYKLGVKTDGTIKDTLSWSGYYTWKTSHDTYRKRYYENQKPFETVETIFGKRVAEALEEDDSVIGSETCIKIELKRGLKLLSYLDSFDEETYTIQEFKTGHLDSTGKVPWTNLKVAKHKQLDFYSMMVKKKFGKVNNHVTLIWLETRFKTKDTEFDGHVLSTQSRELELTGKKVEFKRKITQWERDKMEKEVLKVALEITKDFEVYERITKKESTSSSK